MLRPNSRGNFFDDVVSLHGIMVPYGRSDRKLLRLDNVSPQPSFTSERCIERVPAGQSVVGKRLCCSIADVCDLRPYIDRDRAATHMVLAYLLRTFLGVTPSAWK